jgi:hypothetical protein
MLKTLNTSTSAIGPLYKDAGKGVTLGSDSKVRWLLCSHGLWEVLRAWVKRVKNISRKSKHKCAVIK